MPSGAPDVCAECAVFVPRVPEGMLFSGEGFVCAAPFYYEDTVRRLIHRYKFRGKHALAAPMSVYMARAAESLPPADIVTWIPVSRSRLRKRGYDQAWLLAREMAARMRLPTVQALHKVRDVPTQNALVDRDSRVKNVSGAFEALSGTVEGRQVLLVDDVFTSGATLEECSLILRDRGASRVDCVVFAKTRNLKII